MKRVPVVFSVKTVVRARVENQRQDDNRTAGVERVLQSIRIGKTMSDGGFMVLMACGYCGWEYWFVE